MFKRIDNHTFNRTGEVTNQSVPFLKYSFNDYILHCNNVIYLSDRPLTLIQVGKYIQKEKINVTSIYTVKLNEDEIEQLRNSQPEPSEEEAVVETEEVPAAEESSYEVQETVEEIIEEVIEEEPAFETIYIAYATDSEGNNFNVNDFKEATHIGAYIGTEQEQPTDSEYYNWHELNRTESDTYTHIAYATSLRGAKFNTSYFPEATHLGVYSDDTEEQSGVRKKYTWVKLNNHEGAN